MLRGLERADIRSRPSWLGGTLPESFGIIEEGNLACLVLCTWNWVSPELAPGHWRACYK